MGTLLTFPCMSLKDKRTVASNGMTPHQRDFLDWLVTPKNVRVHSTQSDFAKSINVSPHTLSTWKRDAAFRLAWDSKLGDLQVNPERVDEVMNAMYLSATVGQNVNAAKLWLEVGGRFVPKVEVVDNKKALAEMSDAELAELTGDVLSNELADRLTAEAAG